MRGQIIPTLLFAGLIACVGTTIAVDRARAQEVRTIRLEDAIRIALEQNTDVMRGRADVGLRRTQRVREYTNFLPQIDLSSGVTRSFGRSFSQEEGQILSETSDFFGVNVSATVDLFNGFERVASVNRAGLEEEAAELQLERTRQDVVFQVIEGFVGLLQNRELALVREQELQAQEDLLEQVRALVDVGRQPISDLYQQQAVRAEAEAALVEARRQVELSKTGLIQVLQLDPLLDYEFDAGLPDTIGIGGAEPEADTIPEPGVPGADDYDVDALLQQALARRSDLDALEARVGAGRQGVRAARSGYWPSLSLSFGYGSDWSSEALQPIPGTGSDPRVVTLTPDDGGEPVSFPIPGTGDDPEFTRPALMDQLNQRRGGSVRIALNFPVFDRLQTRTSVQEAQVALLNARYDLQEQRQLIALQVRQAVLDYRSAGSQLEAARERLQAARQARDAARRRYELGAATFVEVAQAESGYVSARSARVQAGYNRILARKLIEYYTGSLDPEAPLYSQGAEE